MGEPLTTEDLYGKSKPAEEVKPPVMPPLPIEETPEIPMLSQTASPQPIPVSPSSSMPSPSHALPPVGMLPRQKPRSAIRTLGTIIFFFILFIVGIWLSSVLREFLPSGSTTTITPTPTPVISRAPSVSQPIASPSAATGGISAWRTYSVISGTTKAPLAGVQFQLPSEVLSPICDGSGCASQGTYLPGGTRFTVAPRGTGQVLRDFRGTVISDVNGKAFTTKPTTIAGKPAVEFTGGFTGGTLSGYVFSKMRGVMIELSPTLSLEINHFTPSGITSDFEKDDVLFTNILKTVTVTGYTAITNTPTPTKISTQAATLTPTKLPTATPTGN
jgi:hypothetical protein